MCIKLNEIIICPIEKFIQLALSIGLDENQSNKLADELISSECSVAKEIKEDCQRKLGWQKFRESTKHQREISTKWKGSRAF